jgi:Family of unknown function (DUF6261)
MFRLSLNSIPSKSKGEASLQIVELLKKHITDDVIISELSNSLMQASENLIGSLGPKNEVELTRQIKELDDKRDDAFRSLVYGLQVHTHLSNDDNRLKAQLILDYLLSDNLGFLSEAYMSESSMLNDKIDFLEKEDNMGFLTEFHLVLPFESLKSANEEFNQLYHQRIIKKANRPDTIVVSSFPVDNLLRSTYYYLRGINFDQELAKMIFEPIVKAKKYKSKPEEDVNPA